MGEVYNGMYLVEGNIDKIKDIVSKKKATKIDGVMVDLFTASAISQVYDKAGSSTKKKMEILPITKLASVVMKLINSGHHDEHNEADLDEARQLKDPKKEMMVKSKDSGVIVIDKKDFKKYQKCVTSE